jgi:hypothetical protein
VEPKRFFPLILRLELSWAAPDLLRTAARHRLKTQAAGGTRFANDEHERPKSERKAPVEYEVSTEIMTVREVAQYLKVHTATVYVGSGR